MKSKLLSLVLVPLVAGGIFSCSGKRDEELRKPQRSDFEQANFMKVIPVMRDQSPSATGGYSVFIKDTNGDGRVDTIYSFNGNHVSPEIVVKKEYNDLEPVDSLEEMNPELQKIATRLAKDIKEFSYEYSKNKYDAVMKRENDK